MSSEDATHSPTIKAAFALLVALNIVLMWLVAAPMLSRRHAGGMRVWGLGDPQIIAKSIPGAAQQDDQHSNAIDHSSHSLERLEDPLACPEVNITVGYNVFIWPPQDWRFLVGSQLQDLVASGLLECAEMLIAITVPEEHPGYTYMELQSLMQEAVGFVRGQDAGENATIIQQHENLYEYPMIQSLYRIAHNDPDDAVSKNHLFMYFHTNGMVNHGVLTERIDRDIFNATVVPWRGVVQHFLADDNIRVAGYRPSIDGLIWRNYWWARGHWLRRLPQPPRDPPNRWYYEYWLSYRPEEIKKRSKVFSTCTCDTSLTVPPGNARQPDPECVNWEWTPDRCMP